MKSLDELLSERAQEQYKDALTKVLDPVSWTSENRDSKLAEIRTLAEGVCDVSEAFVKELLDTKVEDRSIIWLKIREQFIVGEIELLMGFRDELDMVVDIPTDSPISYPWLNEQIKARHKEISLVNEQIMKATSQEGEVEAL